MKKRSFRLELLVAVALVLFSTSAAVAEVGIGPYIDFGSGGGELEWDDTNRSWDVLTGTAGVGFALDTAPVGPSVFNYRLNVGLESRAFEDDDNDDNSLEMGGIGVENIFGFAVVRKPTLRWWIGPLLRVGVYGGESDDYWDISSGDRVKIDDAELVEVGIGVATGVNIPLGKSRKVILAPTAGLRFVGVGGEATYINYSAGTRTDRDLTGGYSTAFVNLAVLF